MKKDDIYTMITDRVIEKLKQGVVAWQKPWNTILPCNYKTRRAYNGINLWICLFNDFKSPYYLTFKQVTDMKGSVKKGSKGTPIVFWEFLKTSKVNADGVKEDRNIPLLKYFVVFNEEQIENIEFEKLPENRVQDVSVLDEIIKNMPNAPRFEEIKSMVNVACYMPSMDIINMPPKEAFKSTDGYYGTLVHELVHSTGHGTRLNREGVTGRVEKGSEVYAFEELIAEMGSAFLCNMVGIVGNMDNNTAYIQSWIKRLQNDNSFIFKASKQSEMAVKYIKGEIEEKKIEEPLKQVA